MDEARARGLEFVILHAIDRGRPPYAALGWSPTAEMAIAAPRA